MALHSMKPESINVFILFLSCRVESRKPDDPIQVHIVRISANESLSYIAKKDKEHYVITNLEQ